MSRTKEIDNLVVTGWRCDGVVIGDRDTGLVPHDLLKQIPKGAKIKLIIELPERRVEITESEFDEAVESFYHDRQPQLQMKVYLKQKLFGSTK